MHVLPWGVVVISVILLCLYLFLIQPDPALHGVAHSPNHNLCPLLIHHALDGGHVVGALEVVVFNARGSGYLLSSFTQVWPLTIFFSRLFVPKI